jgi:hypothetical protein
MKEHADCQVNDGDAKTDDYREAEIISVIACASPACGCGLVYMRLHDADRRVFGTAAFRVDQIPELQANLGKAAGQVPPVLRQPVAGTA